MSCRQLDGLIIRLNDVANHALLCTLFHQVQLASKELPGAL